MKKRRKLNKYIFLLMGMIILAAIAVPGVSAYEGHRINITAHVKKKFECGGATRTWGWWKNRPVAVEWVINDVGVIDMGWLDPITDKYQIMGVFYADKFVDSDGIDRNDLCETKIKAAKFVLAALLNYYSPNGAPIPKTPEEIQAIMDGNNATEIENLGNLLNAYNVSYDSENLTLGIPISIGSADPDLAKSWALEEFADCP